MNKIGIAMMLAGILALAGCAPGASWEDEAAIEKSDRLLSDTVEAEWSVEGAAGGESIVRVRLGANDGTPIEAFDVNHEKLLHLIVVSEDQSYFNHIHPEYEGDGEFRIANVFPAGGRYRLIADFKPTNGDAMTKLTWVDVEGPRAEPAPVAPADLPAVAVAAGTRVTLRADGLVAEAPTALSFALEDGATGEPVTDLEPYLGAIGHVVVLSEDGERYVHVHAEEAQGSGPAAAFEATFPKPGVYKIWGQFQRDGEVFTVAYAVEVR
ncbi:hypothetical protein [Paenibacillus sp.]|uniref:hypothetical protein n=1 Tax=Paenibacillus sp. TaxID=58172 RepID=UPI002D3DE276|nr:hypothetical protein [Paenibacillus sp.]HZG57429.1 hypothetical protein [Paenibacillus sp.]